MFAEKIISNETNILAETPEASSSGEYKNIKIENYLESQNIPQVDNIPNSSIDTDNFQTVGATFDINSE